MYAVVFRCKNNKRNNKVSLAQRAMLFLIFVRFKQKLKITLTNLILTPVSCIFYLYAHLSITMFKTSRLKYFLFLHGSRSAGNVSCRCSLSVCQHKYSKEGQYSILKLRVVIHQYCHNSCIWQIRFGPTNHILLL